MQIEGVSQLAQWLKEAKFAVVLTGAGMSTESGLPDFRSNQGLWHGRDPQEIASVYALQHNRDQFVEFYRWRIREANQYKPHRGHYLLAEWQQKGIIKEIITQNVDGFHHQAGSPSVIELHGTLRELYCQQCGVRTQSERYLQEGGEVCSACNGFLRPAIVLFGEMLDQEAVEKSFEASRQADLFIVLGSSLQVSPANMLPLEAKQSGARLAIVNLHQTEMDDQADQVILGKVGEVLQQVDAILKQ